MLLCKAYAVTEARQSGIVASRWYRSCVREGSDHRCKSLAKAQSHELHDEPRFQQTFMQQVMRVHCYSARIAALEPERSKEAAPGSVIHNVGQSFPKRLQITMAADMAQRSIQQNGLLTRHVSCHKQRG